MKKASLILLLIVGCGVLLLAPAWADELLRVFVTGTGAQAETIHHLNKRCRELTVTADREKAYYVVQRDRTGAGMGRNPHKIAVFNRDGDAIYSGSAKTVGGAIKDACKAIREDIKINQQAAEKSR